MSNDHGGGISGGGPATAFETHTAVVMLLGDRAYKVKKPVNLGFLDFTRREAREAVCHREVELNRRLAPDAYLGVWDVLDPNGEPCDHMVVMRRMPPDRRLAELVRRGVDVTEEVRHLARLVAAFHSTARRDVEISAEGTRDAIQRRWTDSFRQVVPFRGGVLDDVLADEIEHRTLDFLAGRDALFAERLADGRIVDGHADLLAEDVFCLPDGVQVLDCIEFDDRLRYVDGLDDIAFLAMDLEYLGQPRLGAQLLDWYAEFAADPAPAALRHHFVADRAFVRAKVACMRHAQGDESASAEVARHVELTVDHLRAGTVSLLLVGGAPATGKSTLAGALADRLGATLISSDHVRKELAGVPAHTSATAGYREGLYSADWTERTYGELLHRAELLLARGETVILDASWTTRASRDAATELAVRTHSALVPLRCTADPAVVAARIRARAGSESDADEEIAFRLAAEAEPWPEARIIPTERSLDDCLADAVRAVGWR